MSRARGGLGSVLGSYGGVKCACQMTNGELVGREPASERTRDKERSRQIVCLLVA